MKSTTGYIFERGNRWVARVSYTDETGKRRSVTKFCENKTEANLALRKLVRKIEKRATLEVDAERMTFGEAAERYQKLKVIDAQYVGDVKVAGMRSSGPKYYVKALKEHFGQKRLQKIKPADIEAYKLKRLATPYTRKVGDEAKKYERSLTAVNRELETMRVIFNFAKRQRWITESPFAIGEKLINKGAEVSRDRVLSYDEEERLLAQCVDARAHLRPIVIAALDTGLRKGELFKLEWGDVDFVNRVIKLRSKTTKTMRSRTVAMTERLYGELLRLWNANGGVSLSVFGIKYDVKRSFANACREAKVSGLRFHDLRHTCVTRLIGAGIAVSEAMKISGHATLTMLSRYQNVDVEIAQRGASALDRHRGERKKKGSV